MRGFGYIEKGGIGQKYISIVFQASDVTNLAYSIQIFGN